MQHWLTYHFFKQKDGPEIPELSTGEIKSVCSYQNQLLFSMSDDQLLVLPSLDDDTLIPADFEISGKVVHVESATNSSHLLIVSYEDKTFNFTIYDVYSFKAMYLIKLKSEEFETIPYIACSPELKTIAFTLDKKNIMAFINVPTGDVDTLQTLKMKPKIHNLDSEITGIFVGSERRKNGQIKDFIFVPNNDSIVCYSVKKRDIKSTKIDSVGYSPIDGQNTAVISEFGCRLYLCRKNVVSVYTPEKRLIEDEFTLDVKPKKIFRYRQYIVSVVDTDKPANSMKIYDIKTHCIFGVNNLGLNTKFLINEWGSIILILNDGKIAVLTEPDVETKITQLCGRYNQFDVALKLAQNYELSPSVVATIHHNKGDTYYEKRKYEDAIQEYIQAIGFLEPSYVIKKFLDPQFAHYLIEYLETLQKNSNILTPSAKKLNTTLLFNCYIKLRLKDKIQNQIKIAEECCKTGSEPPFDLDEAVEVLDRANFDDDALNLAKVIGKHETYIKLLSEANKIPLIVEYLPQMPPRKVEKVLLEHGPAIFDVLDSDSINSFITQIANACNVGFNNDPKKVLEPTTISPLFSLYPQYYLLFLTRMADIAVDKMTTTLWNDYISCAIRFSPSKLESIVSNPKAKYSSEQALIIIKENQLALQNLQKQYITAKRKNQEVNIDIEDVQQKLDYIRKALRFVYKERGLYIEILQSSLPEEFLGICHDFNNENVWKEAIIQLVQISISDKQNQPKYFEILKQIIKEVSENNIITFAEILNILSRCQTTTLELIHDLLINDLSKLQETVQERSTELSGLDKELSDITKVIDQCKDEYFVIKPGSCRACSLKIDRPSRHFLCGHSFHLGCLGDETSICPICKETHLINAQNKLDSINQAKTETNILHLLEDAEDPQEALNKILQGSYFDPELESGSEEMANDLIARMNLHDE